MDFVGRAAAEQAVERVVGQLGKGAAEVGQPQFGVTHGAVIAGMLAGHQFFRRHHYRVVAGALLAAAAVAAAGLPAAVAHELFAAGIVGSLKGGAGHAAQRRQFGGAGAHGVGKAFPKHRLLRQQRGKGGGGIQALSGGHPLPVVGRMRPVAGGQQGNGIDAFGGQYRHAAGAQHAVGQVRPPQQHPCQPQLRPGGQRADQAA